MKPHAVHTIQSAARPHRGQFDDLLYGALFVIGAPIVVIGSMYLVEVLFTLAWR